MDSVPEIWKAVKGFEGMYEVSNMGRVRSLDREILQLSRSGTLVSIRHKGRVLREWTMDNGYSSIRFCGRTRLVHHLVLEAFVGPCPDGFEACHDPDHTRTNNALSNLRWDTPSANQMDRVKHGTSNRGERSPVSKLTEQQAIEILNSPESGIDLARRFGVSRPTICDIRTGRTWAHLQTEASA